MIILVILALICCSNNVVSAIKEKSKLLHIEVEKMQVNSAPFVSKSSRPEDDKFLQFGGQPSAFIELENINN